MSHIGIVAVSHQGLGGTFQYTLSMIDALRRIGRNRYTIFTSEGNHSYDDLGFPLRRLPPVARTLIEIARVRALPTASGGLFSEVDKLIAPIYTTRLLASRRPFIFTLHDMQERYYPENFTVAQRIWRATVNRVLSHAAAGIICESNYVKSDINKFLGVNESKIRVIPAPPVSEFLRDNIDCAEIKGVVELALPGQFIFYPAQFFPHKNHLRLIEAFSRLAQRHPACHLVLTGQRKYQFGKVMARVKELGLEERVRHLGYVDTDTLAGVYLRATLVAIPTLFESISIPVYEAFRLGVPVCASNVVALPEQIGDAGILFDPLSVDDITQKLSYMLEHPEMRDHFARKGRERIETLTANRYAAQLEAVLDQVE